MLYKHLPSCFNVVLQETGNILNFCEVGLRISGVSPISSQAALHFPNTSLVSVSMATTERHTVAFLGTSDGTLKKVNFKLYTVICYVKSYIVTFCTLQLKEAVIYSLFGLRSISIDTLDTCFMNIFFDRRMK